MRPGVAYLVRPEDPSFERRSILTAHHRQAKIRSRSHILIPVTIEIGDDRRTRDPRQKDIVAVNELGGHAPVKRAVSMPGVHLVVPRTSDNLRLAVAVEIPQDRACLHRATSALRPTRNCRTVVEMKREDLVVVSCIAGF